MPFFRRKSAVPAIFRQFWLQKSVLLTVEPCLMVGIVVNNVFLWKNKEILGKSPMKICKNGDFRHFRPEKNFSQNKSVSAMFWALLMRIFMEKIRKNLWWNLEKMPKNRFFRHTSGIFPRKWIFSGNRAPSHFGHCHFASLCQKSAKIMSQSREKLVTDGRTDGRTDNGKFIGPPR